MSGIKTYKIKITIGTEEISAVLDDNATTRDFIQLLPLTMELKDYASTEKIYDLPEKLSTAGAPAGSAGNSGDITYYAPWGNLAIFYKDFGYSSGLIKLGRIEGNMSTFKKSGAVTATFELMK